MRQTKLIKIQNEIIKTLDLFMIGPNTISIEAFTNNQYKLTMQIGMLWQSTRYFTTTQFDSHYREIIRDIIKEIVTNAMKYYLFR